MLNEPLETSALAPRENDLQLIVSTSLKIPPEAALQLKAPTKINAPKLKPVPEATEAPVPVKVILGILNSVFPLVPPQLILRATFDEFTSAMLNPPVVAEIVKLSS